MCVDIRYSTSRTTVTGTVDSIKNIGYMDSLFQELPEVMITGERPIVKAEQGKLVYDVPRLVGQPACG